MRLCQTFHPQQGCWLNAATSDPSQPDEAEELIPTNPRIIINKKSLLFQSTGFWSSLLYNNRYGKYHFITLGISGEKNKSNREPSFTQSLEGQNEPLLDYGVWGYRKLLTVQISGRFHHCYCSCGHNCLSNLRAGDWKLGSWVASTYSCPPSFQLSHHSGWKMAHVIAAFEISHNVI